MPAATLLTQHPNLLSELYALAHLCHAQGDFSRAEQHYRLALNLYESSFPEQHVEAMLCLNGLIHLLEAQNKTAELDKAERMQQDFNVRRRLY